MEKDICLYVRKLDNQIHRQVHTLYSRKAIDECTLGNMWVVDYLFRNRERALYQKDIESQFSINRATASKMLKRMEEKQLICRELSESDSRLKRITLLKKGYELQKLCVTIRRELEEEVSAALTEDEREVFRSLCSKIMEHLSCVEN